MSNTDTTDSIEPETIYTYYEKVYADPADSIFWYGFGQGILGFLAGSNTSLGVSLSDGFCHAWDAVTGRYELVLHSETVYYEGEEESEYNSRRRSRSTVLPDNTEYTPVTRTEYELTYYVNNVNTENTQVLMEYDEYGRLKNSYTYGNERISIAGEEETDYYVYDGRGSVSQVVNADEIVEAYTYDPFGNVTSGAPVFESFYGYNAEETNPVTGLQYLRARYYDSTTGRFCVADSYLGDVTNPLTLNRYIYTLNNPVMYNDPSGHFVGTALLIAAAVAAGVGIAVGLTGDTRKEEKTVVNTNSSTEIKERDVNAPKYISSASRLKSGNEIGKEFVNNAVRTLEEKISKVNSIDEEIKNYIRGTNKVEEGSSIEEKIDELNEERIQLCETMELNYKIVSDMGDTISTIPELPILGESPYKYSKKYNTAKEFAEAYRDKIQPYAEQNGYDMDFLLSVLFVESNGAGYNEEGLVRIRFENHKFYEYLPADKIDKAEEYFNNDKSENHTIKLGDAEPIRLHVNDQYLEYTAFEIAKSIDENAAYMAISMGMGQVMGFNHKVLGYDSPKEMYEDFCKGEDRHILGVLSYMNSIPALQEAIINKNSYDVAKYYNGGDEGRRNTYSNSIKQAYTNIKGE